MFLKLSFVLRILLKTICYAIIVLLVSYLLSTIIDLNGHWTWYLLIALLAALIEDKISIERRHTLLYLPVKSDMSAFSWLEGKSYNLMVKKKNRRIYARHANRWYERNDFVRITLLEDRLKLKLNNELAKNFESDFKSLVNAD